MVDLVANISVALEIVNKLRGLNKKVSEADFKMLLVDLTSELGDAKLHAANLKIDLAEAREKFEELKREMAHSKSAEPEVHEGGYVFDDKTRHYCTGCYDARGQKILLTEQSGPWRGFGKWMCPVCEKTSGPTR